MTIFLTFHNRFMMLVHMEVHSKGYFFNDDSIWIWSGVVMQPLMTPCYNWSSCFMCFYIAVIRGVQIGGHMALARPNIFSNPLRTFASPIFDNYLRPCLEQVWKDQRMLSKQVLIKSVTNFLLYFSKYFQFINGVLRSFRFFR